MCDIPVHRWKHARATAAPHRGDPKTSPPRIAVRPRRRGSAGRRAGEFSGHLGADFVARRDEPNRKEGDEGVPARLEAREIENRELHIEITGESPRNGCSSRVASASTSSRLVVRTDLTATGTETGGGARVPEYVSVSVRPFGVAAAANLDFSLTLLADACVYRDGRFTTVCENVLARQAKALLSLPPQRFAVQVVLPAHEATASSYMPVVGL